MNKNKYLLHLNSFEEQTNTCTQHKGKEYVDGDAHEAYKIYYIDIYLLQFSHLRKNGMVCCNGYGWDAKLGECTRK